MFSWMSMCHLLNTHSLLSMTMKLPLIESCYPITQALQIQHLLHNILKELGLWSVLTKT
ncbi:hypothetical protein NC651_001264 [Populus alba x Populus x berolinensis]|uniref:Uncharacterized protein n=1 Tax=Populus alba x Populus x berolinensis TaxID=444605 RepID=A0AAD6R9V9_9ROSI|nr:hypothetical protein NC651_021137 [Populus alba x Populus x berolinensis]KAJ6946474.1 hypothetical protein NC651_001264 [Populus alba x Populus x berolinensis]KAJ7004981.1 hypothetical protein NC653_009717 [Populus alba x Populus x berolinensis]